MRVYRHGAYALDLNKPDVLKKLLESHGLSVETREEWCVPNGELPAIRTAWVTADSATTGRLDVEVVLGDERRVLESFAGPGTTVDEQQGNALQNFLLSSFHVLLAAFWGQLDEEQVVVERWTISGAPWSAYVGGFSTRASVGTEAEIPEQYFEQISQKLHEAPLAADTHWCRTFFCHIGSPGSDSGERIHEALLDNERWEQGEEMMKAVNWARSEGFYSVRNFLVLRRGSFSQ